ncbi:MAG: metallophosphoesterase [Clostridia bacterium]|nr:metallophosphoesterase [Clostridia bacterium]
MINAKKLFTLDVLVVLLAAVIGLNYGLICGVNQVINGNVTEGFPQAPADFVPTVRFVVFTDSHNNNARIAAMIDKAYEMFDDDEKYQGIDAVCSLGDFTSIGTEPDYDAFISTLNEHIRPGTKTICILGNHEVKQDYALDMFREKFGYEPDTVTEINGFSFIALSSYPHATEWTYPRSSIRWAKEQLAAAEAKNDGRAVFALQHPHNFATVYGSSFYCEPQLNTVWGGHSEVVCFSGHSHFPSCDPRSLNQSDFTNVGCGAIDRFELEKNCLINQHPENYDKAAEFTVVEADNDGSVRILGYDLNSGTCFRDAYIDDVNDVENYTYSYKNMKHNDPAPVIKAETACTADQHENGEWIISFDEAEDAFIVHDYTVKITDENGKRVYREKLIDDYYCFDEDSTADFNIGADTLQPGKTYQVTIVAENAYGKTSEPLTVSVTAEPA